ncbi:MAG: sterol desaturase family protein [Geminicoccaceae bacterium]|nr:sterol desaturase family protein [Geminicoccaceae bacterium]MCX7629821.1 sterol desaturase family protein [Geminicoccaceae bacterium]MDW8340739.1 sterol desaturase family protein [Geminicoccaceae bacterium]
MDAFLLAHEPILRLGSFFVVLLAMAAAEVVSPRRRREIPRLLRWANNLALVALDTAILRLGLPVLAVGAALWAESARAGLFHLLDPPRWLAIAATVVVLDLLVYAQHRLFHAVPVLWRVHRVHHADLEFDVTTGVRFHPIEILLSMLLKTAAVVALGAPPEAVVLFEIVLNAMALFTHSNVKLPERVEALLRLVVVTPDMHRVHHSVRPIETDSNFGFNLSLWDRFFGTYRPAPFGGHEGMIIGIELFREPRELWLDRMLTQPFRGAASGRGRRIERGEADERAIERADEAARVAARELVDEGPPGARPREQTP